MKTIHLLFFLMIVKTGFSQISVKMRCVCREDISTVQFTTATSAPDKSIWNRIDLKFRNKQQNYFGSQIFKGDTLIIKNAIITTDDKFYYASDNINSLRSPYPGVTILFDKKYFNCSANIIYRYPKSIIL